LEEKMIRPITDTFRCVVEMIEWYATQGGAVATSLPGWPHHLSQSAEIERLKRWKAYAGLQNSLFE
jgi:hypothetical protein